MQRHIYVVCILIGIWKNSEMLKELNDIKVHLDFINEVNSDLNFSDPMLCTDENVKFNLLEASNNPANHIYGVFEENVLVALFVFLILDDEKYIEMLVGLSKSLKAYDEIFSFLKEEYKGYSIDFVYNPNNYLLDEILHNEQAEFEVEQQKMLLKDVRIHHSNYPVELYSQKYDEQYKQMHSTDVYWTADKVIAATDVFRIILAIKDEEVVGYMDITHKFDENEPYDIFVKPEYRRKGYAKAMLAKAIELNKPHKMNALVDVDNVGAISLFHSLGFEKVVGENNITAHLML